MVLPQLNTTAFVGHGRKNPGSTQMFCICLDVLNRCNTHVHKIAQSTLSCTFRVFDVPGLQVIRDTAITLNDDIGLRLHYEGVQHEICSKKADVDNITDTILEKDEEIGSLTDKRGQLVRNMPLVQTSLNILPSSVPD